MSETGNVEQVVASQTNTENLNTPQKLQEPSALSPQAKHIAFSLGANAAVDNQNVTPSEAKEVMDLFKDSAPVEPFDQANFQVISKKIEDFQIKAGSRDIPEQEQQDFVTLLYQNANLLKQALSRGSLTTESALHSLRKLPVIIGKLGGTHNLAPGISDKIENFYYDFPLQNLNQLESILQHSSASTSTETIEFLLELSNYLEGASEARRLQGKAAYDLLVRGSHAFIQRFGDADEIGRMIITLSSILADQTGEKVVGQIIKDFGLNEGQLLPYWDKTKSLPFWEKSRGGRVSEITAIANLEHHRPGASKALFKEFNIRNFSRYPMELLIKQYDERNNKDIPYGVILYPLADHNGAFHDPALLLQLFQQVDKFGYGLRVFECGSRMDLGRAIISADRRYGRSNLGGPIKENKISFAIIGGHGTPTTIQFGEDTNKIAEPPRQELTKRQELTRRDVHILGMHDISRFFQQNPSILLNSCSTGEVNGIGQEMSSIGAEVVAPNIPTVPVNISVSKDSAGQLHFTAQYSREAKSMIYKQGQRAA